jgi:hypothetical protein
MLSFALAQAQYNAGMLMNDNSAARQTNSGFLNVITGTPTYPLSPQYVGHTFGLYG